MDVFLLLPALCSLPRQTQFTIGALLTNFTVASTLPTFGPLAGDGDDDEEDGDDDDAGTPCAGVFDG